MNNDTDKRLVLLHAKDNIFVCCQTIRANESIRLEGRLLTLDTDIPVGHKLARHDIPPRGKIIKYGASIGSAKAAIVSGDHVHLHNLKSDYMPSYQRSGLVNDQITDKPNAQEETA